MKTSKVDKFTEFLLKRSERLDEEIIASMKPDVDLWIDRVQTAPFTQQPDWWETRESVRLIAEGTAFFPSETVVTDDDLFENVFPDLKSKWKNLNEGVWRNIGEPCDPTEHPT